MAVNLKSASRKRLSMTSLIDVIFLLLLFFMLTSTFSKFAEVDLVSAGSGTSVPAGEDRPKLFLKLDEAGFSLNGQSVDLSRLPDLISRQPDDGRGHLVLISPAESASSQQLVDLLVALRGIENLQTMVLG